MLRHLAWAFLLAGCASSAPPEPRVVERVVYVEAPCRAPVIVEHHPQRPPPRAELRRHRYSRAHPVRRPHWVEKRYEHCARKPTLEAQRACRKNVARSAKRRP